MGLFSGSKKIYVSSTLYNVAGPEKDRPNYLKSTLYNTVMQDLPSTADGIRESYFNGPGLQQRQFYNYAKRQQLKGFPETSIVTAEPIDGQMVAPHISTPATPAGITTVVQRAEIVGADPDQFIYRWLLENHPEEAALDWTGDFDPNTGEFSVQTDSGDFYTFTDSQYRDNRNYIIASYLHVAPDETGAIVDGSTQEYVLNLPSEVTEGTKVAESPSTSNVTLQRTRTIWPGNDSNLEYTEDGDVSGVLNTGTETWEITRFTDVVGAETYGTKSIYNVTYIDQVVAGYSSVVFEGPDRVATTGEMIERRYSVFTQTQEEIKNRNVDGTQLFIYTIGSGITALDNLFQDSNFGGTSDFFPILPLRIDNHSIRHSGYKDRFYEETKRAYRRLTDGKYIDELLDQIEDNEDIDDIDYAYIYMGTSLNAKEQSARRYMFDFFAEMRQHQRSNASSISDFQDALDQYAADVTTYDAWLNAIQNAQTNQDWESVPERPSYPELSLPPSTTVRLTTNQIRNASNHSENGFDFRLTWNHVSDIVTKSGDFLVDQEDGSKNWSKEKEVQIDVVSPLQWTVLKGADYKSGIVSLAMQERINEQMEVIRIRKDIGGNQYQEFFIYGLIHQNYVYGGKSVDTRSTEAMNDDDPSPMIIPLNYQIMKKMSIVDYTQLATANMHIVFNSYEVVKKKWYQNFFLVLIVMVVIIAAAAFIAPAAFAGAGGFLGGNAAVGASLGLTGAAAVAAGAVANYLAAVVISQVIGIVSVEVFGEKWGAVVAAIAMFAMGGGFNGLSFDFGSILKLGNVLANGYAGYVKGDIAEKAEDVEAKKEEYEKRMEEIQKLIDGLGGNDLNFNPLTLTDTSYGNDSSSSGGYLPETADEFIRRTTMSMSDLIEISQGLVHNFVEIHLTLPKTIQ